MEWFSVYLQARNPADTPAPDEAAVTKLVDLLEPYDGIVTAGTGSWEATISIRAMKLATAAKIGQEVIQANALKALIPMWPPVRVEAVRHDVLAERLQGSGDRG